MAAPILLKVPPDDPREALYRRLENAPKEHAEALLAACDILQGLHDRGLLELAKGALGSSEKVLQIAVDAVNTPEAIGAIRRSLILAKLVNAVDLGLLEGLERAVPEGLAEAAKAEPMGFFSILRKLFSRDSFRVFVAAACILESLGKSLGSAKAK
jgi:uncharacterized protein YjgD (DUF1641 family)